MNDMFRREDQQPLSPGDVIRIGHEDWNGRINRAIASETAWKRITWAALAMLAASGGFNVWQGQQSKVDVVHVIHDAVGAVIDVHLSSGGGSKPTEAQIAAAIRQWVTDVRTVYIDVNALRRSITAAYAAIPKGSQARGQLDEFYQQNDPFKRAALETVSVANVVAIPPPPGNLGKDDLQTWRVEWLETVTGRDGAIRWQGKQVLTVSFTVTPPQTREDAVANPNGWHLISFAWTRA